MHDLGGLDPEDVDDEATFLDLGFDSLFLTQAGLAFKKKFGIKVSLRQLLEDAPTPGSLARHLDGRLEPGAFREEWAQVTPVPAPALPTPAAAAAPLVAPSPQPISPAGVGAASSVIEETVRTQLQVMARQLEVLAALGRDGSAASGPAASAGRRATRSNPAPRPPSVCAIRPADRDGLGDRVSA